jgi:CBS domain containing-hemolysin-like protein
MIAWFFILCCWSFSFLFAGIEAGLLSIDAVRLRHHVKQRRSAALRLNDLLKHPERLLVTVLLVTNLADIFALLLLTRQFVRAFGYPGYAAAFALALPVYIFILGILPKTLFRRFPFRALAALAGLLEITTAILSPLLTAGGRIGRLILSRKVSEKPRLFVAREELKQLTAQSEREGSLTPVERAMIHNVVDFRNVRVADVMLLLPTVVSISAEASTTELLDKSVATGVDDLPVISADGNAVGIVNALDVLMDQSQPRPLHAYTRRLITAKENDPAYRVIRRLRAARLSLAAVIDDQQKLSGIVTSEDMIRRLVQSA